MGWMRTLLLGDIGNRLDIADAEDQIGLLKSQQKQARQRLVQKELTIENLRSEVAQQRLAIQALTRFLVKKEILAADELDDFIKEVDAEDGVIDGKMSMTEGKVRLRFD
jgi:chromosome condensin MukBEF ATPase and DNA-binding subunit MukB